MTDRAGTIFLHFPCFDGLVSAAIAWDFLERSKGWAIDDIRPVNYDVRGTWLEIARSLAIGADRQYCDYLLRHMRNQTLATIAGLPGFSTEFGKAIWSYFPAAAQAAAQSDKGGNV